MTGRDLASCIYIIWLVILLKNSLNLSILAKHNESNVLIGII